MHTIVNHSPSPASPPILLSLLFAAGLRPSAADVVAHAERQGSFMVSHRPAEGAGWLELLANGLTFDLHGLSPAPAAEPFDFIHRYALPDMRDFPKLEAVTLAPGPHLAGAEAMLPVVRGVAGLAAALATLPGCEAIGWHPARTLAGAAHFSRSVGNWLEGGAFPALGLTALSRDDAGAMRSEGLAFLIGRELRVVPSEAVASADAKLAMRLIDLLVETGGGGVPARVEAMPGVKVALCNVASGLIQARRAEP